MFIIMLPIDIYIYLNPYEKGYTYIYIVIGIILLAISHWNLPGGRYLKNCQYVNSPHISDQLGTENAW